MATPNPALMTNAPTASGRMPSSAIQYIPARPAPVTQVLQTAAPPPPAASQGADASDGGFMYTPSVNNKLDDPNVIPEELQTRHDVVTGRTRGVYGGDIMPPATEANILRSLKFFVYVFYLWNILIFSYAFLIPFTMPLPYGGLDIRDFELTRMGVIAMFIVFSLATVRILGFAWSKQFYHYIIYLAMFESACLLFTIRFWSHGLPVIAVLILSGILNTCICQNYFFKTFFDVVQKMQQLVPSSHRKLWDHSNFDNGWMPGWEDLFRLLGARDWNPSDIWNERSGVYGHNHPLKMGHVEALKRCYAQAMMPDNPSIAQWQRDSTELWPVTSFGKWPWMYLDGILFALGWYVTSALSGIWLGQTICDWIYSQWTWGSVQVVAICTVLLIIRFFAYIRTTRWLSEALGVSVAEKEWLAHDILRHGGQRDQSQFDVVDMSLNPERTGPFFVGGFHPFYSVLENEVNQGLGGGRLNLTFMWLCANAVANSVGASYLAKLCQNLAVETRNMISDMTAFEFKKVWETQWEITIAMILMHSFQMLVLMWMLVVYFGSYFEYHQIGPPQVLIFLLGAICFGTSVCSLGEALLFAGVIMPRGEKTPRLTCVSESVMLAVFFFVLVCILFTCFLMPIMRGWDFPLVSCDDSDWVRHLFPSACSNLG